MRRRRSFISLMNVNGTSLMPKKIAEGFTPQKRLNFLMGGPVFYVFEKKGASVISIRTSGVGRHGLPNLTLCAVSDRV